VVDLTAAAAIWANQRQTFSLVSVAMTEFNPVEFESVDIRCPFY
jgi:hypothetical protein